MVAPISINDQKVWIGCSGYVYKHWHGAFYPPDLPSTRWLQHYTQYFPTVELNNTHYILPSEKTFEGWAKNAPEGFLYAVKANRFITHMKKLKEPEEPLKRMFDRAVLLGPKLGPVLYQLPPRWRYNGERLEAFLRALPQGYRHAVEVRETSWLNDDFFGMLERFGVAFCIASLPHYQTPILATAPFVYIRFHGSGEMYYYKYTPDELRFWRDVVHRFATEARDVYCYFNNDPNAWAVQDALELMRLVSA
jgi:uncharacterized protein YecE (DUF72 family)